MKLHRLVTAVFVMLAVMGIFGGGTRSALAQSCGPNVTHVVQAGQNLFRISLNYGTNYPSVAAANGITDPTRIYVGQVLVMVCPSGGSSSWHPTNTTTTSTQPTTNVVLPPPPNNNTIAVPVIPASVDCTRFRVTHPRDGFTNTTQDFYWEGAPGATSYRVSVFNADLRAGTLVAVQDVPGPLTSASIPFGVGYIGAGFRFSYRVQALVADSVVCSTPLLTLFRAS
jgi:LysM domain